MSSQHAMKSLLRGLNADVQTYNTLHALLDLQFTAALDHDGERLTEVAEKILALAEALEKRRQERVLLVRQLLPQHPQPGISAVLQLLPPPSRAVMTPLWRTLEGLVRECKERNARNGRLMTDQQAVFQRVLHGEEESIYAAA